MRISLILVACTAIIFTLVVISVDGISYKFTSVECRDVNKDIFETESCTVNGSSATIITTLKKSLNKINVSLKIHKVSVTHNFSFRLLLECTCMRTTNTVRFLNSARLNGARLWMDLVRNPTT